MEMPAGLEKQGCLQGRLAGTALVGMRGLWLGRGGALGQLSQGLGCFFIPRLRGQGSGPLTIAWLGGQEKQHLAPLLLPMPFRTSKGTPKPSV